jgi:O-antigen ligase
VCFLESKSALLKTFCLLTVLVCLCAIGFSGSRRGWLILCGVGVYLIVKGVKTFLVRLMDSRAGLTVSRKRIWTVLCASVIVAFLCLCAWSYTNEVLLGGLSRLEKLEVRFKSIFFGERSSADPFSERLERWDFAAELIEDRALLEILFGSGFGYLGSYGERSPGVKEEGDPHNFVIAAMLYSELVGVFLILALISYAFFKLYKNRKTYGSEFFLIFLTTILFWSVGGNSLFSVKILPVIILTILSLENGKNDEKDLSFSVSR